MALYAGGLYPHTRRGENGDVARKEEQRRLLRVLEKWELEEARSAAVVLLTCLAERYRLDFTDRLVMAADAVIREDSCFRAILEKSVVGKWWTRLFPDKFKNDFNDVLVQLKKDPFKSIDNIFEVELGLDSSSYEMTGVTLREELNLFEEGRPAVSPEGKSVTIDSKACLERSLFTISKDMMNIITSYFERKEILVAN